MFIVLVNVLFASLVDECKEHESLNRIENPVSDIKKQWIFLHFLAHKQIIPIDCLNDSEHNYVKCPKCNYHAFFLFSLVLNDRHIIAFVLSYIKQLRNRLVFLSVHDMQDHT